MEVAGQAALAFLWKSWQGPGELQCPWRKQSETPPKMGASRRIGRADWGRKVRSALEQGRAGN